MQWIAKARLSVNAVGPKPRLFACEPLKSLIVTMPEEFAAMLGYLQPSTASVAVGSNNVSPLLQEKLSAQDDRVLVLQLFSRRMAAEQIDRPIDPDSTAGHHSQLRNVEVGYHLAPTSQPK